MVEADTIKLLKECNAGIKMGVRSLEEVLPSVKNKELRQVLMESREEHSKLGDETHILLNRYHDDGKEPHPIAKSMSWMKTEMKLAMQETDATVANLITDGCNMGVKSLYRYLNQYPAAGDEVKAIVEKLIAQETHLVEKMRPYL